jgi:multiple sugar transport system substrate-binding protein
MAAAEDDSTFTRRHFLRLAAGGATLLATGASCGPESESRDPEAVTGTTAAGGKGRPTLRIIQWNHYVAGYDQWWDGEYTKRWGDRHGIEVVVDHIDINQATAHAEAEVASQRGHDLFFLNLASPVRFEDHVIDHRDIVEEAQAKLGKMPSFVERSIYNPKTNKYYAFSDFWSPNPVHYRTDLWNGRPDTWDAVLSTGRRLKSEGHPVGIGMSLDAESNVTLLGLMHAFGASVQDEDANVTVNSKSAVEAVKIGVELFRSAMPEEVLGWDITSNNRYFVSGRGSLIINSVAAIRALEAQNPALAARTGLLPAPAGPAGRHSPYVVGAFTIWKFSENQEAAKRFLIDLVSDYHDPLVYSGFIQMPSFPGAVADLETVVGSDPRAQPPEKYRLMADAAEWSANLGYPGHTNAAIDEVVKASVISQMFAAAARGEATPEQAVRTAEARIKPIYDKWREIGKI